MERSRAKSTPISLFHRRQLASSTYSYGFFPIQSSDGNWLLVPLGLRPGPHSRSHSWRRHVLISIISAWFLAVHASRPRRIRHRNLATKVPILTRPGYRGRLANSFLALGESDHLPTQFVTNKGRVFVAGLYMRVDWTRFILIERPGQKLGRIFFESSASGIGALAFATDAPKIEHLRFKRPQPSPNSILVTIDNYFFSSHSLDHLEEITPCFAKDGTGVTGLILHYPNGHRGSLGQVRLDSLGDRFTVSEAPSWFLRFGKRQGRFPFVLEVATCRPKMDGDVQDVMEIFRAGKLEWIWSERQCLVIYNGCRGPLTV